ncbi:MAG: hypothetical protein WBM50_09145 [Acidimicrobiales bacterium]
MAGAETYEARNLPHVLPAIPDWVHEIILVDGGSTDGFIGALIGGHHPRRARAPGALDAERLTPTRRVVTSSARSD